MPNAATFDDDLVSGQEARAASRNSPRRGTPRKPRASGPSGRKKKKSRWPRLDLHRVARVAAIGMASTMAIGIMVNALMLQKGHHPAPLFGQIAIVAAKPAVATTPPAASTERGRIEAGIDEHAAVAQPRVRNAAGPRVAESEATAGTDDAIARLIAGGGAGPGAKADATDARTVANVQRALTKLGFKVPATGSMGPATRKAIEAYEKDRHLPAKGDIDRRLVRALSAEAKTKID